MKPLLCLLLSSWLSISANAQETRITNIDIEDGPNAMRLASLSAFRALALGNFEELEKLFERWNNPGERLLDGTWKLSAFSVGVQNFYAEGNLWPHRYEPLKQWRLRFPKSKAAAVAEANYWRTYAWHARGPGFANTVTKEGWALFNERIERAEQALLESKEYASDNPLWYREYLEVALSMGWPRSEFRKLFDEAVAKAPLFYHHYYAMTIKLTPAWGGNYEQLEKFAQQSIRRADMSEGASLYARLYWMIDSQLPLNFDLFRDSRVSWPTLQRAFDELRTQRPKSKWILHAYASFACRARDRTTYLRLRAQMGNDKFEDVWHPAHTQDVCDRRYPPVKT